jgi:leucyl-tRNA synthetase
LFSDNSPATIGRSEKMSKSKKNVVDPEEIISTYGADTARLFMLSDSPPERDLDWTDTGIEGAWRYTQRLHRLVLDCHPERSEGSSLAETKKDPSASPQDDSMGLRRIMHKTIKAVTENLETFRFNSAVARLRELSNAIEAFKGDAKTRGAAVETLLILLNPLMPHIAEELWQKLGHKKMLVETAWPKFDAALVIDEEVTIAVQINGKMRGTIQMPRDSAEDKVKQNVLAQDFVQKALEGKVANKIIVVPNRIVNVLAG